MYRKCIVHIGMHKTGSTSIQRTLYDGPIHNGQYCKASSLANHGSLLRSIFMLNNSNKKHMYRALSGLIKDIGQTNDTYVLSAEGLASGLYTLEVLHQLKEILLIHFNEIIIIGYVRSPKAFMESAFQERLKGGMAKLNFKTLYPHYRKRLEKFDKVFGKENVKLFKFDNSSLFNRCVVQDFCKCAGISVPVENIKRENESLSYAAISLLYTYRLYASYDNNARVHRDGQLIKSLISLNGPKLRFASDVINPVISNNTNDIAWIENRLGQIIIESTVDDSSVLVHSDEDLLQYHPETLLWLSQQINENYSEKNYTQVSSEMVSNWMRKLHYKADEIA